MQRTSTLLTILATLLALVTASVPPAAAEGPLNGTCDESDMIVCAGADVGANVQCDMTRSGYADCWWTYGWITTAFSPLGLSGEESHEVTVAVEVCAGSSPCETGVQTFSSECTWLPGMACDDSVGSETFATATQLAFGECLRVTVTLDIGIEASAPDVGTTLGTVTFENTGGDAGARCYENNGRG